MYTKILDFKIFCANLHFRVRGQKAYYDGRIGIMIDMYTCTFNEMNILYIPVRSSLSGL